MRDYLKKKPSHEGMRRGIKLIEAFAEELDMKELFRRFPNWKTDYGDYAPMLHYAREIAQQGYRLKTEARGYWGPGSQVITAGTIEFAGRLDYKSVLEKATDRIYERIRKVIPPQEEINRIVLEFDSKPHENFIKELDDLRFSLGMASRDDVERHLFAKLVEYLKRKQEKLNPYQQEKH